MLTQLPVSKSLCLHHQRIVSSLIPGRRGCLKPAIMHGHAAQQLAAFPVYYLSGRNSRQHYTLSTRPTASSSGTQFCPLVASPSVLSAIGHMLCPTPIAQPYESAIGIGTTLGHKEQLKVGPKKVITTGCTRLIGPFTWCLETCRCISLLEKIKSLQYHLMFSRA